MTTRQTKAIAALVSEPTKRAAAAKAGISESTLRSYLSDPAFMAEYRAAVSSMLDDATRESQQALSPALSCLREVTTDTEAPATARIAAARSLLEYALRLTEFTDVVARLNELEENVSELEGHK